jgi:asparagine synthase (glutamine-hydrolysing)
MEARPVGAKSLMCGICGIFNLCKQERINHAALEAMNQAILHRGPDDAGCFVSEEVGLAMRRLSIVDLKTGHQPMTNEDGSVYVVFNGEIYNHAELRPRLQQLGHRYRSTSDTESIVHLYEEYGRECLTHLRGMFAFALWDAKKHTLLLARDRFGIKPLYYQLSPRNLLFASEIKALLAYPNAPRELNSAAVPEYLAFGYLSGDETLFNGIRKLPPGHTLEIDQNNHVSIQQYWDLPAPEPEDKPDRYFIDGYRARLEAAVSSHLMSDVPLGVFLSGGIDSSTVAALVTKLRGGEIETFSVGYGEEQYSELSYAREMARHIGSVHHEVRLSCEEFFDLLPQLIWHEDEPITWPSSVSLYAVARLAGEHVKVVLTGEGSDETLAGYKRYAWTRWNLAAHHIYRHLAPSALRGQLRDAIAQSNGFGAQMRRKLGHTFLGRDGNSWPSLYFDNFYSAFSIADQADLMKTPPLTPDAVYGNSLRFLNRNSGDLLSRLLYTDMKTYLQELLRKQDAMSMAASIESRVPFLDQELVEFSNRIPSRLKMRGFTGKHVLKQAVRDLLPDSILLRKKLGFPTPLSRWLHGPSLELVERVLFDPRSLERGLFHPIALRRLFVEHRARSHDHCDRIWRLLNLELWQRIFLDHDTNSLQAMRRS